jgi:cell division protein ZapA (FtsZ GTPase activity inhibitor)
MTENHIGGALVEVFGEEYEIATTDARQVRKIAAYVDAKMCEIAELHGGRVPTAKLAVLAAMTIADELFKSAHQQAQIAETAQENLQRLTQLVDERADMFSSLLDRAAVQPVGQPEAVSVE